jgi:hypothetical protein
LFDDLGILAYLREEGVNASYTRMPRPTSALGGGVVSMVRGGGFDQKHSAQFMLARVGFQDIALLLLIFALLISL